MATNRQKTINVVTLIAALVYLSFSALEISDRFERIWPGRGIDYGIQITQPIEAETTAIWSFLPQVDSIDSIWLFFRPMGKSEIAREINISLLRESTGETISTASQSVSHRSYLKGWIHVSIPQALLNRSDRYQLAINLPSTPVGEGLSLHFLSNEKSLGRVVCGDETFANSDIEFFWLGVPKAFPWTYLILGVILIGALFGGLRSGYLRNTLTILASLAVMLLIAIHFRDLRVSNFFGNYWPDEYMAMSQIWRRFFSGSINFTALSENLSVWRNGQVILFPLLIGLAQSVGATPSYAYFLVVVLFSLASLIVFLVASDQLGFESRLDQSCVLILLLSNPMLIRSTASLQTDIGGLFFALLSVTLLVQTLDTSGTRRLIYAALAGLAIYCGIVTRLALAPLVILPVCIASWRVFTGSGRGIRTYFMVCLPCLLALILTSLTWWSLDLFGTLKLAKDFAENSRFRSHFNWPRFSEISLYSLQLSVIPIVASSKAYFRNAKLATIAGGIIGLLCILAVGKIIPWFRYWAPIGILSTYFCLAYLSTSKRKSLYLSAYTVATVAINLWLILSKDVLAQ